MRAGHEPAFFYDPVANKFYELAGSGMALGVDKHCRYEINRKDDIPRGSILMLATDGVWETRNASGQMFGRRAICDIIRKNSMAGADNIIKAIFEQISKFRKGAEPEDDITLVVLKFL